MDMKPDNKHTATATDTTIYPYWDEDGLWHWMHQFKTKAKPKIVRKKPKRKRQKSVTHQFHLKIKTKFYAAE